MISPQSTSELAKLARKQKNVKHAWIERLHIAKVDFLDSQSINTTRADGADNDHLRGATSVADAADQPTDATCVEGADNICQIARYLHVKNYRSIVIFKIVKFSETSRTLFGVSRTVNNDFTDDSKF